MSPRQTQEKEDPPNSTVMTKTISACWSSSSDWANNLPWSETRVLVPHAMLYITLSLVMIFTVDGYLTDDDSTSHIVSRGRFKLQSSDVITLVAVGAMVTSWVAGMWSSSVVFKSGYIIWLNNKAKEHRGKDEAIDRLRWTVDRRFPIKLDGRLDYTLIRISLFLIFPVLFATPLLQGSLSWKSSTEAAGYSHVESRTPGSTLWAWGWPAVLVSGDGSPVDDLGTGWLAGLTWDNITASHGGDTTQTCRHVMTHAQFPVGSKIFNAIIPCIIIHDIFWPDPTAANATPGRFPPNVQTVAEDPTLLNTVRGQRVFGHAATIAVFDPTNNTIPLAPRRTTADSKPISTRQPTYPSPFLWSGVMNVLVVKNTTGYFPPYWSDPFGPLDDSQRRYILPAGGVVPIYATGQVLPAQHLAYLQINFTAGVINASSATYIRPTVIEADHVEAGEIIPHPWVREAISLLTDVITLMGTFNQTLAIPTWGNLEGYTATTIGLAYMAAWTGLVRSYETNSTTLAVRVVEPRLQAVVSLWRVLLWLGINVLFSASWVVSRILHGRYEVIRKIAGPADFVRELLGDIYSDKREEKIYITKG